MEVLEALSACCSGQEEIKPRDLLQPQPFLRDDGPNYLFMSSIAHIMQLKRGPFNEHSPVLFSIATTVPNWQKINYGLLKMYQAEVLEKCPVVQHFYFGSLLPWTNPTSGEQLPRSHGANNRAEDELHALSHIDGLMKTSAPWAISSGGSRAATTASVATAGPQLPTTARMPPGRASLSERVHVVQHSNSARGTMASTGSVAALSSPLGAIPRPTAGLPRPTGPE